MAQPIASACQQSGFIQKPSGERRQARNQRPQLPLPRAAGQVHEARPTYRGVLPPAQSPPGLFHVSSDKLPLRSAPGAAASDSGSDHESTTCSGLSSFTLVCCTSDGRESPEGPATARDAHSDVAPDDSPACPPGLGPFPSPPADETPGARRIDGEMLPVPPGLAPPPEIPSHGSTLHAAGQCRPCNWFWKPGGCNFGVNCSCCHLCPATELKARKKNKHAHLRLSVASPWQRGVASRGAASP